MSNSILFTPLKAGAFHLPNRIVMAPLTRCRSSACIHRRGHSDSRQATRQSRCLLLARQWLLLGLTHA